MMKIMTAVLLVLLTVPCIAGTLTVDADFPECGILMSDEFGIILEYPIYISTPGKYTFFAYPAPGYSLNNWLLWAENDSVTPTGTRISLMFSGDIDVELTANFEKDGE